MKNCNCGGYFKEDGFCSICGAKNINGKMSYKKGGYDMARKKEKDPNEYVECSGCGSFIKVANLKERFPFGGYFCPVCEEELDNVEIEKKKGV